MDKKPCLERAKLTQNIDVTAVITQFLNEVSIHDVFIELIQNDLDAGASFTKFIFNQERLTVIGNGKPIDKPGWRRLSYIAGAGGEVEAKENGIGAKNHGLRTLWLIGDVIEVYSKNHYTMLSIADDDKYIKPATYQEPSYLKDATESGVRLEVEYRKEELKVRAKHSDLPKLKKLELNVLDGIIEEMIASIPKRVLGAIHPKCSKKYTIEIQRFNLPIHRFEFSLGQIRKHSKTWLRYCRHFFSGSILSTRVEQTFNIKLPLLSLPDSPNKIPLCYKEHKAVRMEYSWSLTENKAISNEDGFLRYPLEYLNKKSDMKLSISAPFVSDRARQSEAPGNDWNKALIIASYDNLYLVIREAMKKHGAKAYELIKTESTTSNTINDRLLRLINNNVIVLEGGNGKAVLGGSFGGRVFLPCLYYRKKFNKKIFKCIPSNVKTISKNTPDWVFKIFREISREYQTSIRIFDEADLINLLCHHNDLNYGTFSTTSEWRFSIRNTEWVRGVLNIIEESSGYNLHMVKAEGLMLPNDNGTPKLLDELVQSKTPIPKIKGVNSFDLLHPELVGHPALKKEPLKVGWFKLDDWLKSIDPVFLDDDSKKRIFLWFKNTQKNILKGNHLRLLKELPIWPSLDGSFHNFDELCQLDLKVIPSSFEKVLHVPHWKLEGIKAVKKSGKGILRIRKLPHEDELLAWYRLMTYEWTDLTPLVEIHKFEQSILKLSKNNLIKSYIKDIVEEHYTKSLAGKLVLAKDLYSKEVSKRYGLEPEDTVYDGFTLEKLIYLNGNPSCLAIINAFKSKPDMNFIFDRLKAFFHNAPDEEIKEKLRKIPFINISDSWHRPDEIKLSPNNTNPWGTWRIKVDQRSFSNNTVKYLKELGAVGHKIDIVGSIRYFRWLMTKSEKNVLINIKNIFSHWKSEKGPKAWWEDSYCDDIPCLPVSLKSSLKLYSFNDAKYAWIPDFKPIEEIARENDKIAIVVHRTQGVSYCIFEEVVDYVRRMSCDAKQVGDPKIIEPKGVNNNLHNILFVMQKRKFQNEFNHRLHDFAVSKIVLKPQWKSRINSIKNVRICKLIKKLYRLGRVTLPVEVNSEVWDGTLFIKSESKELIDDLFNAISNEIFKCDLVEPFHVSALKYVLNDQSSLFNSVFDEDDSEQDEDDSEQDEDDSEQDEDDSEQDEDDLGQGEDDLGQDEDDSGQDEGDSGQGKDDSGQDEYDSGQDEDDSEQGKSEGENSGTGDGNGKHPRWKPDWSKQSPAPKDFEDGDFPIRPKPKRKPRNKNSSRPRNNKEEIHIDQLKWKHYSMHCQICLGSEEASSLAPKGSYIEFAEFRKELIEAHHPAAYASDGERHAGNLLCLCLIHHYEIGDTVSPLQIRRSLDSTVSCNRTFSSGNKNIVVEGLSSQITFEGKMKKIWWTVQHANYWRRKWSTD